MAEEAEEQAAPTPEEIAALKEKVAKLEELEKTKAELEGKVKEYESDEQNMNWQKARAKEKRLLAAIKAAGKDVDEEGNVVQGARAFTEEELDKRVSAQVERNLVEKTVARSEKDLAESDRPIFRKALEKAMYGETVTSDNIDGFVETAMLIAGKGYSAASRTARVRGGPPVFAEKKDDFAESDTGKQLASKMGLKIESKSK